MVPQIPAEHRMTVPMAEPVPAIRSPIGSPIQSPCNKVCVVHPVHKLCIGCGRSLDEIARWIDLDAGERRRIIALLPSRLATISATAPTKA
jgi:predicted Fe-S protein YdhL (DUF1289 family)